MGESEQSRSVERDDRGKKVRRETIAGKLGKFSLVFNTQVWGESWFQKKN